jgi:hypothetical protein
VSRITVYNQFGSKSGLLASLAPRHEHQTMPAGGSPREQLDHHIQLCCAVWADAPALHRHLPHSGHEGASDTARVLAERLADADELRPGCSIKEAEDVISALTSFAVFDRLHKDGRRSPSAVAEIVRRLASTLLT